MLVALTACFPNWICLHHDFCKKERQKSCAKSDVASLSIERIVLEAAVLLGQRNVGETFPLCTCTRSGEVDQEEI